MFPWYLAFISLAVRAIAPSLWAAAGPASPRACRASHMPRGVHSRWAANGWNRKDLAWCSGEEENRAATGTSA